MTVAQIERLLTGEPFQRVKLITRGGEPLEVSDRRCLYLVRTGELWYFRRIDQPDAEFDHPRVLNVADLERAVPSETGPSHGTL